MITQTADAQKVGDQDPSSYAFGKITRVYNSVANSTGVVPALTGTTDEGVYNNLPIGFTFRYAGVNYTTAAASTNGWMTMGQNIAVAGAAPANNLAAATGGPVLAPLWDNLQMDAGGFYYQTVGSAPDRVFTAEWNNVRWDNMAMAGVGCISFQVKLYEGSNRVEFLYRQAIGTVTTAGGGASIGLAGGAAPGTFVSLNGTGPSPVASSALETSNLTAKPASGQVYVFTPSVAAPAVAAYAFGAADGAYVSLQPNTPLTGGTPDDGSYNGLPIGFTFRFAGVDYTTASASTNGWMTLGQFVPTAALNDGEANDLDGSRNSSVAGVRPLLAPLWDDLSMGSGAFYHFTSGTAPNRVFTAEWYNAKWNYSAANPAISFQVRLYEGSNRIEYSYRPEAGAIGTAVGATETPFGASIGLAIGKGANNFISFSDAGANPTLSYTTETNTIGAKPVSGQVFSFAPAPGLQRFVNTTPVVAGAFASIASTGTRAVLPAGTTADEGYYNGLPIGFTFRYAGAAATTASVSTNGWLTVGQNITDAAPANDLSTGGRRLAPLWDDLSLTQGNVYYQTAGIAPNRIFTVEWANALWEKGASAPTISFQAKLYEGTNRVEYVYKRETGVVNGSKLSASIGVSDAAGSFVALGDFAGTSTSTTTDKGIYIQGRPATDQVFAFSPLALDFTPRTSTYTNGIPLSGGTADEGYYNGLPIGFSFNYDGQDVTTVSASTNGWLTLGQDITAPDPGNNIASGGRRLAPLWDDISLEQGSLYYQTSGTAPRRVFTVEWYKTLWEKAAAAPTLSFEVKLYEGTNRIEFIYSREAATPTLSLLSASIGITGKLGKYVSVQDFSGTSAKNNAAANSVNSRPVTAQIFGFAPAGINPLPVELVRFAGQAQGTDARLTWATAQELNNDRFELERSADGSAFGLVASVPGHGTTAQPQAYTYTDARAVAPGHTVYYRLRQVDFDGSAKYSPVVAVANNGPSEAPTLQLLPNPAHDRVQLLGAGAATARILDLAGRVLRTQPSSEPLVLAGLAPGLYLVQCGPRTARLQVD